MHPEPIITKGAFDSQNLAFWDAERRRVPRVPPRLPRGPGHPYGHVVRLPALDRTGVPRLRAGADQRAVYESDRPLLSGTHRFSWGSRRGTSTVAGPNRPSKCRVTITGNCETKGSPREGTAVTDGMFITSRDRQNFSVWPESFLRPGLRRIRQLVLWRHLSELGTGRNPIGDRRRTARAVALRHRTHAAGNGGRSSSVLLANGRVRLAPRPAGRRRARDETASVCGPPVLAELLHLRGRQHRR